MIVETYEYKKLSRTNDNGSRKYLTPDGNKVASVTSILDRTKPQEAVQALHRWRQNVGHAKAAAITMEAAGRGTRMHTYLEKYIESDKLLTPGSNPFAQQSNKMAEVIINNGLKNLDFAYGVEISLYYPELYAGTTDVAGVYKGKPAIVDFKQTNKPKTDSRVQDYKLQLAAYALAHNVVYNTNIELGVILMCSKDYEFQTWELGGKEFELCTEEWLDRVAMFYNV